MSIKINGKKRSLKRIVAVILIIAAFIVTNSAIDAECDHNDAAIETFLSK